MIDKKIINKDSIDFVQLNDFLYIRNKSVHNNYIPNKDEFDVYFKLISNMLLLNNKIIEIPDYFIKEPIIETDRNKKWGDSIRLFFSNEPFIDFFESYNDGDYVYDLIGKYYFIGVISNVNEIIMIFYLAERFCPDRLLEKMDYLFGEWIKKKIKNIFQEYENISIRLEFIERPDFEGDFSERILL